MKHYKNIYFADNNSINKAVEIILAGGIIGMPTETVYGLGADATNSNAVVKIYEAKKRPSFDPLIVHVSSKEQAWDLTEDIPETAHKLAEAFWPGPLTLVLRRKTNKDNSNDKAPFLVTKMVSGGLSTVALRMPAHPIARKLIEASGRPIAAPSANVFGSTSPTTAQHVAKGLGEKLEIILDGGSCTTGVESTVILPKNGQEKSVILRPGGLEKEKIEQVIGKVEVSQSTSNPKDINSTRHFGNKANISPGMSKRHYATNTPLYIVDSLEQAVFQAKKEQGKKIGLLGFNKRPEASSLFSTIEILSLTGDLSKAAVNLFSAMHRLDEAGLDMIFAQSVPRRGLGIAINDRLSRAVAF